MLLIIDSGATKADWRVVREDGTRVGRILTGGMNMSSMTEEAILSVIREAGTGLEPFRGSISAIFLYTAGVLSSNLRQKLETALSGIVAPHSTGEPYRDLAGAVAPHANGASSKAKGSHAATITVDIQDDLTGCARAVCGHAPGIAAILGTGSNSCQFDGKAITAHINTGGFILGDEGSASALGKLFVSDLIKGLVPKEIADAFAKDHDSSYAGIVQKVYRSAGSPSGYLGSLAPFILDHYSHPYIKDMVDGNFRAFIDRCLRRYEVEKYPVGIVGGFGCACRHIFGPLAEEAGIKVSGYISEPVEGLIKYHTC